MEIEIDSAEFLNQVRKSVKEFTQVLHAMDTKEQRLEFLDTLDLEDIVVSQALIQTYGKSIEQDEFETCAAISNYLDKFGLQINLEEIPENEDIHEFEPTVIGTPKIRESIKPKELKDEKDLFDVAVRQVAAVLCYIEDRHEKREILDEIEMTPTFLRILYEAYKEIAGQREKETCEVIKEYFESKGYYLDKEDIEE